MSNVHNVYNATIERRSESLPPVPGIGRGWPKPSSGSISDFGRHHPSYHPPSISHLWINRIIGQANRQLPDVFDIISLDKKKITT